ncbi:MAG: hypothetical protein WAQ33_02910 [Gaiellaceae bacterium]
MGRLEGNPRLLILRAAALALWVACVVFLLLPTGGRQSAPFHGGRPFQPKQTPARGL